MKKVSALLLTAVLGSSMVFAGIGGSVKTTYGFDLDTKIAAFGNNNAVEASFDFTTEDSKIGEGEIYAEITGKMVIHTGDIVGAADDAPVTFTLDDNIDYTAKIIGSNWCIDITGVDGIADYASDFATNDDDDTYHNWEFAGSDVDGISGSYTYEEGKTVKLALGSWMDFENMDSKNYLAIATPAYMLAEGVTAEAALAVKNNNSDFDLGAGMKMAMVNDDYSATVAVDMGYIATADTFDVEASMNGTYSLATIDAYFATNVGATNTGDEADYTFDGVAGANLLSVKLTADLNEVVENVPVTVYTQFSSKDAADSRMNAGADYTIAMDMASMAVGIDAGLVFGTDDWMIGGDVEYTAADEAYVACASVKFKNLTNEIVPEVSVETTTLVDGATLTLAYDGISMLLDDLSTSDPGAITATCLIEF